MPVTPNFWKTLDIRTGDWIIGAKHAAKPARERLISLARGATCIVPRGVWHRLIIRQPSDLMFVTPAAGTKIRPVTKSKRAKERS